MTNSEAMTWLREVNGRLYHTRKRPEKPEAWVAVVQIPGESVKTGKMIIALGKSAGEATSAAEETWQTLWSDLSNMH
jgi:hypothetical protein